jgi:hypothetical protein
MARRSTHTRRRRPDLRTARRSTAPLPRRATPSGGLRAGDRGDLEVAVQIARDAVAADPLDAEAFVMGLVELARERPRAAID